MRIKTTLASIAAALFFSCSLFAQSFTTPPQSPVRAMAEWEELQSLIITWRDHPDILSEIVRAARQECNVVICCNNATVVTQAKSKLTSKGVDFSSNVSFVVVPNNSVWVRDYGPNCVYSNDVDSLYFVDWIYNRTNRPQDNVIASTLAPYFGVPLYNTSAAPTDLVNTGGNFMSDGMGTAFASKLILSENDSANPYGVSVKTESQIDGILSDFMGIDRYIKMTALPYDLIHHIDMHMKLLDEETLLVGQYPEGIADGPQIEANIQYVLNHFQSAFGTPYKVIRIPMPPQDGDYPDVGADYRTYANAVFVNKTVILPFYETQYDTTAQRIWQESLPGYKIVGVDCNSIIGLSGAIHCITKEVGVNDPLRIIHQELQCQENGNTPGGYAVNASIQHRSGIAGAKIFYTTDLSAAWQNTDMWQGIIANDDWFGSIPAQAGGSTVYYYIEASAVNGKTFARPITAPEGWWKFCVTPASGTDEPAAVTLLDIYPNPASAITAVPVQSAAKAQGNILVYNSLGQMVEEVFEGEIPSGSSTYFLDAGKLAGGTYYVKLQTRGQVQVKKLIVK